jgi:integrase
MLRFAVTGRLLPSNPLEGARRERCRAHRETFITEGELGRLLKVMNEPMRAMTLVCIDAGLRFNECRLMQREWVSPDGVVRIPGAITKTRKGRAVKLTKRALDALNALPTVEGSPKYFVTYRRRTGDGARWALKYGSRLGPKVVKLYSERRFRSWFRTACLATGVDAVVARGDVRLRIHDLRHSAATAALRRGASLVAVKGMLGHSNLSITSRYLHTDDAEVSGIARLMEQGAAAEACAQHMAGMQNISDEAGRAG